MTGVSAKLKEKEALAESKRLEDLANLKRRFGPGFGPADAETVPAVPPGQASRDRRADRWRVAPPVNSVAEEKSKIGNLADLQNEYIEPLKVIVKGFFTEGLAILAGRPKVGKSWFALNLGLCVAMGTPFLGEQVAEADVLYVALEDGKRRIKTRVAKILGETNRAKWPARFQYTFLIPSLDAGGAKVIDDWVVAHPGGLVIIDVLGKVLGDKRKDESPYKAEQRIVGMLQEIAISRRVLILAIHHVRKATAEDVLDTISGTTAVAGTADAPMALSRVPQGFRFYCRSRDTEDFDKVLVHDNRWRWSVVGDYDETVDALSGLRARVVIYLRKCAPEPKTPAEVAEAIKELPTTIGKTLQRLASEGIVFKSKTLQGGYHVLRAN